MTKLNIFPIKKFNKRRLIVPISMNIEIFFQTPFIKFCLTFKEKTNQKISLLSW